MKHICITGICFSLAQHRNNIPSWLWLCLFFSCANIRGEIRPSWWWFAVDLLAATWGYVWETGPRKALAQEHNTVWGPWCLTKALYRCSSVCFETKQKVLFFCLCFSLLVKNYFLNLFLLSTGKRCYCKMFCIAEMAIICEMNMKYSVSVRVCLAICVLSKGSQSRLQIHECSQSVIYVLV